MKKVFLFVTLLLAMTLSATRTTSLDGGLVLLDINGAGQNMTFTVTDNDPSQAALFLVYNAAPEVDGQGVSHPTGTLVVWSYQQAPNTTGPAQPVPTTDNFGQPITWTVGQVTSKFGTFTGIVSPPWALTMVQ